MNSKVDKKTNPLFRKLGWAGIGLCGLCCALPFIGIAAGIASLTTIGMLMEKVAIALLGMSGIFFAWHWLLKRKTAQGSCEASCDTNCDCKDDEKINI